MFSYNRTHCTLRAISRHRENRNKQTEKKNITWTRRHGDGRKEDKTPEIKGIRKLRRKNVFFFTYLHPTSANPDLGSDPEAEKQTGKTNQSTSRPPSALRPRPRQP